MNNEMKIQKEELLEVYKAANKAGAEKICEMMEDLFGKDTFKPKDVTERIKTFEDAIRELGEGHQYVRDYREWKRIGHAGGKDIEAYLKLRIIVAALNEGWKPTFGKDERRYYPWFNVYSKEELEEMDEEERSRVVGRAYYSCASVRGVLAYGIANVASSYSNTYNGSRLAFKSKELAIYCGKQFIDIWVDFIC